MYVLHVYVWFTCPFNPSPLLTFFDDVFDFLCLSSLLTLFLMIFLRYDIDGRTVISDCNINEIYILSKSVQVMIRSRLMVVVNDSEM